MQRYENIKQGVTVQIIFVFCPMCGKKVAIQVDSEIPAWLTHPCRCGRDLMIKLDHNSLRIDVSYDSRSDT